MSDAYACPVCGQPLDAHDLVRPVAARLGYHTSTVYRMLATGELRALKLGAQWRICPGAVDAYLRRCSDREGAA